MGSVNRRPGLASASSRAALQIDRNGFLTDRFKWSKAVAHAIAEQDGVALTKEHWFVIQFFRSYYETYNLPPPMRLIIGQFQKTFAGQHVTSRYLHKLFPGGPTRTASKYAGLPKPKNCR